MLFPEGTVRVQAYGQPVDMRCSSDGLYALTRNRLGADSLSGDLYVLINRRGTQMKVLYWDRSGFCVWAKRLDPKVFETTFRRWVGGVVGAFRGTIAVDGKTVRGSATGGESAIHMVSAFATDLGVVLGQEKVAGKSNEITAIPELLDALYLRGFLVSIDAMGCQKRIAQQITTKGGDYLLMVKGNQPSLQKAIETSFISPP